MLALYTRIRRRPLAQRQFAASIPQPLADTGPTLAPAPEVVSIGPCGFLKGTSLRTPLGQTHVEYLREGDLVSTDNHGTLPIRWIGWNYMTFGEGDETLKPIMVKRHAIAPGVPARDTALSPHQTVLLRGPGVAFHTGFREVLIQAQSLLAFPRVRRMKGKGEARYYSVLLDHHAVLWADGMPVESFYPCDDTLEALGGIQREAIEMQFPALVDEAQDTHSTQQASPAYGTPLCPRLDGEDSATLTHALARKKRA